MFYWLPMTVNFTMVILGVILITFVYTLAFETYVSLGCDESRTNECR